MTISHKVNLFGLVLARLKPYQKRMKPKCDLWIEYEDNHHLGDRIYIRTHRWDEGELMDSKYFYYKFDDPSECNINTFIDEVIEKIKPFCY